MLPRTWRAILLGGAAVAAAGPAQAQFEEVVGTAPGVTSTSAGVSWVDHDGDGALDLFVTTYGNTFENSQNRLFRNAGASGFQDVTDPTIEVPDHFCTGVAWADYDDDGDPDLFLNSESPEGITLARNDGSDGFAPVTPAIFRTSSYNYGAAWVDLDRDGDLDLSFASREGARLFRNDGGEAFADVTVPPFDIPSWCIRWCDYDGDGDPDAFLGGPNGTSSVLARNEGDGTFTDVAAADLADPGGIAMSGDFADYDGDGDEDLYVVRFFLPDLLFRNDGEDVFTAVTSPALEGGGISYTGMWSDFDNDGDPDLLRCGLDSTRSTLLRNDEGTFADVSALLGPEARYVWGASWGDYDGDGRLDLYLGRGHPFRDALLRNTGSAGYHWLEVRLVGTLSNRDGIGARVEVVVGERRLVDEVSGGGNGWCSQRAPGLWFGLGSSSRAPDVTVHWPSGQVQLVTGVPVDRAVRIVEPGLSVVTSGFTAGEPFDLELDLAGAAVTGAVLHVRRAATGDSFRAVPTELLGQRIRALLPASHATELGVEYRVEYSLRAGSPRRTPFPADAPLFLPAVFENLPMPRRPAAGEFVLFGFPMDAAPSGVPGQLEDDLGPADPGRWRLGRWDPGERRYLEFPGDTLDFTPGGGFWLIQRDPVVVGATGRSVNPAAGMEIVLEPGWNQLSHPFLFEVDLNAIDFSRGRNVERRIVKYRGGGYVEDPVLEPWQGFWMRNASFSPEVIVIPGRPRDRGRARPAPPAEDGWRLEVSATQGPRWDGGNLAGVSPGSGEEAGPEDRYEPPGPPGLVRAYFRTPDVSGSPQELTRDLRPASGGGHAWDLVVEAKGTERLELEFDRVTALPAGLVAVLVPPETLAAIDLRSRDTFDLAPGRTYRFRLLVGTPAYVERARAGGEEGPVSFALGAGYPNPFLERTRIGFTLPNPARVELAVFDVGGRRVRTLLSGVLPAGRHSATWGGMDDRGRSVSSGVYFYRIRAGEFTGTRKLVRRR